MAERIEFTVPLPPAMIRSNSRSHWGRRVGAKQAYSEEVLRAWYEEPPPTPSLSHKAMREWGWVCIRGGGSRVGDYFPEQPLERARVTFTWRACHLPDQANVLGNCKALLDILCMAPRTTQPNNTTYLGLIEDDKGVEAIGKVKKVAHRHLEGVLVTVERL